MYNITSKTNRQARGFSYVRALCPLQMYECISTIYHLHRIVTCYSKGRDLTPCLACILDRFIGSLCLYFDLFLLPQISYSLLPSSSSKKAYISDKNHFARVSSSCFGIFICSPPQGNMAFVVVIIGHSPLTFSFLAVVLALLICLSFF